MRFIMTNCKRTADARYDFSLPACHFFFCLTMSSAKRLCSASGSESEAEDLEALEEELAESSDEDERLLTLEEDLECGNDHFDHGDAFDCELEPGEPRPSISSSGPISIVDGAHCACDPTVMLLQLCQWKVCFVASIAKDGLGWVRDESSTIDTVCAR